MRIALFTTSFPSDNETAINAGACVKDFAEALTDLGHEVEVLTPRKKGARHDFRHARTNWFWWLGDDESLTHIRKTPLGLLKLFSVIVFGSAAAVRLLRRFQPDHVLCFWVFPGGLWARFAQLWVPAPYSVWALGSDIWVLGKLPVFPKILRWIGHRANHRYADGVMLGEQFQSIAGSSVEFLATSRVLAPPPGVEVGEGGYYLFLGRYHQNKGADLLVEAAGRARDRLPEDFRLKLHGFGPLEDMLRSRVRQLGLDRLVSIGGPVKASDVGLLLRRSRGLIIPSRIESIPLILSDGLQMQLPLLVTDVGDMGTLVRRYSAGLVCRPEADDIAEKLLTLTAWTGPSDCTVLRDLLDIRESAKRFVSDIAHGR
ncbi:MAG: glycosyltransferase [Rhodomicrobium sp.]